ncbi:MAG: zinc ribbon domain-containing protein [Candidatus Lutacidiplasmatales archaeon]
MYDRRADPALTLRDRVHRCPCGLTMDRDLNAAKNIVHRGMKLVEDEVRWNTSELTRGESGPPPRRVGRRAYQRRRVGSLNRETVAQSKAGSREGPRGRSSHEPEG